MRRSYSILLHAPEKALPRSEIPFEGLLVAPNWLAASVITSAILLIFAFPEYIPLPARTMRR